MADNKKYYWLKLKENFFEEKQIKYLRKLPEGDKITICYLKMQLKSLRTEGFIKFDSILPSNVEELAMILDEDINIVKLMLQALLNVKAIEILDDGSFYMLAMQDLIGKEGQSAERVRKFREKQKALPLQCNSSVTKCNTEIEIEKEIEKEIEIEIEKDIEIDCKEEDQKTKQTIDYDFFEKKYNEICYNLPNVKKLTDKRKAAIRKFLKEFDKNDFIEICEIANDSNFLTGQNKRKWKADFDFLLRTDKAVSILEGKYITKNGMEDFIDIWEETKNDEARNDTNNFPFG